MENFYVTTADDRGLPAYHYVQASSESDARAVLEELNPDEVIIEVLLLPRPSGPPPHILYSHYVFGGPTPDFTHHELLRIAHRLGIPRDRAEKATRESLGKLIRQELIRELPS